MSVHVGKAYFEDSLFFKEVTLVKVGCTFSEQVPVSITKYMPQRNTQEGGGG